jgi:uncharacterized protein YbjT (DUF2867 family)
MKVILFGASGMIGQAALRECLLDPGVELVVSVGRTTASSSLGAAEPDFREGLEFREIVRPDLFDLAPIASELTDFDACFFCLGVTSAGLSEAAYTRLTYELTVSVGELLAALNPGMTFVYVSGSGTDSSEQGRSMWARVKGRTENALLRLPFRAAYMLRPGFIQPLHGIQSKTRSYRLFYNVLTPVMPLLRRMFPKSIVTTEELGRLMLMLARTGAPKQVLETEDMRALLESSGPA